MKLSRKNLGRVATTFLATAMLASLTAVPAMAEDVTVTFTKTIDMTNAPGATVPDVTYSYTVAAGQSVDAGVNTPEIKAGEATDFTMSPVDFTAADPIPGDKKVSKTSTLTFADDAYTDPGIYRYEVTEAHDVNLADVAFDTDNTYTVDVYVAYVDGVLEVTNAVWMREASTPVIQEGKAVYGNGATTGEGSVKIGGDEDAYTTYSLTVIKEVSGDMADKDRDYEFTIDLSKLQKDAKVSVDGAMVDIGATETGTLSISATLNPGETMTNGNQVVITGIPSEVAYTIAEELAASERYTVTAKINDGQASELTNADGKYGTGSTVIGKDNDTVTFTNIRSAVSPTGIAMDIAPYALLVVIAAAGCFVFLRKRNED